MASGNSLGFGRLGALSLVVSTALALACSGKSSDGDGGDDDETGGTGTGGTSGSGGSGATAGTASGGTSSSPTSCVSVCDRTQACPGAEPLDCASECRDAAAEAASYGCSVEFQNYVACAGTVSNLCNVDPNVTCTGPINAFIACMSGTPSARCNEGAASAGATCLALCERGSSCGAEPTDCATSCAEAATDIAAAGCTSAYQSYLNCAATCENICNISEYDCPITYTAFVDCYVGF